MVKRRFKRGKLEYTLRKHGSGSSVGSGSDEGAGGETSPQIQLDGEAIPEEEDSGQTQVCLMS